MIATGELCYGTVRSKEQISQQCMFRICEFRMESKSKYLIEGSPIIKSIDTSFQTMARKNTCFASAMSSL